MTLSVVPIALLIALIFGVSPIIHKYIFNTLPTITPQTMFIFGGIFYFLFTLIFAFFEKQTLIENIKNVPSSIILIFLFGTAITFFANYLYFKIISKNASYLVSSLIFISPVFTLILSYLFLKEDITITSVIGIVLIVLGVVLVALSNKKPKIPVSSIRGD
jgi:drug/metabolite transporter (DMT)-like permease